MTRRHPTFLTCSGFFTTLPFVMLLFALAVAPLPAGATAAAPNPGDSLADSARSIEASLDLARDQAAVSLRIESMLADGDRIEWCFSCPMDGYPEEVADAYAARDFRPVWLNGDGPSQASIQAITLLKNSFRHGLYPSDYNALTLDALAGHLVAASSSCPLPAPSSSQATPLSLHNAPEHLAIFDLLLSRAFVLFAGHLLNGRTNPAHLEEIWVRANEEPDIPGLFDAIDANVDPLALEASLMPGSGEYQRIMEEADLLRLFAGSSGWTPLPEPENTRMEPGHSEAPFVPELRARFAREGRIFEYTPEDESLYDDVLVEAIKAFQVEHGLDPDGIIGDQTRAALNLSPEERYRKYMVNLERWRWLPRSWDGKVILVNIPAFRLRGLRDGKEELAMKVIVGTRENQTPVFSKPMRYIETYPYWNVPESIALDELLPKIRNNPEYLSKHNYEIVNMRNGDVVDTETLDWSSDAVLSGKRIRQMPGGGNALGVIKFMFPNRFDVYLHDTSQRHLFARINRNLSHGCIRVHDPMGMALFVMGDDPEWTRERIQGLLDSRSRQQVTIPAPLTVHIMYLTAEPMEDGHIRLYRDVYGLDNDVWALLEQARPEQDESLSAAREQAAAL